MTNYKNRHAGGHAPSVAALTNCGIYCLLCTAPRYGCRCCGNAAMTYGRERRGVIQKRFGESFLDGKEGSRGKNAEQGFAAVIVFVPRERIDFFRHAQAGQLSAAQHFCFPSIDRNGFGFFLFALLFRQSQGQNPILVGSSDFVLTNIGNIKASRV